MTKLCKTCARDLPESEFYVGSSKLCKGCMTWNNLTYNSKKEGHELSFTKEIFLTWYGLSDARRCSYCTISEAAFTTLKRTNPRGYEIQCLGLDRSDSSAGYTPENARLACLVCNRIKSNIFGSDEMLIIGQAISRVWTTRGLLA